MPTVTIADSHAGSTARIASELGFNCFDFRVIMNGQSLNVLDSVPGFEMGGQRASGSGIPILFPFPNRIRAGRFSWEGRDFALPVTDRFGNAIHGLCLDRPWRIIAQGTNFVTGQFQLSVDAPDRVPYWPSDFVIEVHYKLVENCLRCSFSIFNPTNRSLPWGLGTHPYFKLPLATDSRMEDCLIEVPAAQRWELIDCLPSGRRLELDEWHDLRDAAYLGSVMLDDVYTSIQSQGRSFDCRILDEKSGLQVTLTAPPVFREIVAFTPPGRQVVCLEPYSCPTDAVNLTARGIECGWRTLKPCEEFQTWHTNTVGSVLA